MFAEFACTKKHGKTIRQLWLPSLVSLRSSCDLALLFVNQLIERLLSCG